MKRQFVFKNEQWVVTTTGDYCRGTSFGSPETSAIKWTASFHKLGDSHQQPIIGWVAKSEVDTVSENDLRVALEYALGR